MHVDSVEVLSVELVISCTMGVVGVGCWCWLILVDLVDLGGSLDFFLWYSTTKCIMIKYFSDCACVLLRLIHSIHSILSYSRFQF